MSSALTFGLTVPLSANTTFALSRKNASAVETNVYDGIITETTIVKAVDKEEAKRKILEDDVDDIIDVSTERLEVRDFVFFNEDEVEE